MAIDKATKQDWQYGGEEALRQAQDALRDLKKEDTKGYFKDADPLTEEQIKSYAKVRAKDTVWDVELADGRKVSVNGDDTTTEADAIQMAKDFYDNPPPEPKTEVETLVEKLVELGKLTQEEADSL